MYTLDGLQRKALHAVLRQAFPHHAALERFVDVHLGEPLGTIAGAGDLDDVVRRLIEWTEAHDRLDALVNGARAEAHGNQQLIAFERAIVSARDERPQDANLRQFAERLHLAPTLPDETELEKRVFRAGFSDIAQWRARLGQAELAVCRIESPAWRALGTGFLIGPDLVMTNRHVVDALASQRKPAIVVRFDFKLSPDGSRLREGQAFPVARDWLVASSAVEQLDFAVLRLEEPAGVKPTGGTAGAPPRGWITPRWRDLEPDETIFVIQHPQGETLKLATGRYDSREPTRLRYRVDTEAGSSGSPCFTAQMELVAIHRGSAEGLANQGVPFDAITAALPAGFFPPARPETSAIDTNRAVQAIVEAVDAAARPVVERTADRPKRWLPAWLTVGLLAALGLASVSLWWSRGSAPPVSASPRQQGPASEVSVFYQSSQEDGEGQCASDAKYERALYRLESAAQWPAPDSPRAREVQLITIGPIEIESASMAMQGGIEALDVVLPNRTAVRKGMFREAIVAPVVVVVCVRTPTPIRPSPAFRLNTWKEGGS